MNKNKNQIVLFFAGPRREASVKKVLDAGLPVKAIFIPLKRREAQRESMERVMRWADECDIPIIEVRPQWMVEKMTPYQGAIFFNIGGEYIYPPEVIKIFDVMFNVHPTLLPRYRGITSIAHVILKGDKKQGTTVHIIDGGIDTGPIVLQKSFEVTKFDTYQSLQQKTYDLEPDMVLEVLQMALEDKIQSIPQVEPEKCTTDLDRHPMDSEIDPQLPLADLYDSIRASDPNRFPTFFMLDGQRIEVRINICEPDHGDEA